MNLIYKDDIIGEVRTSIKNDCYAIADNMRKQDAIGAWSVLRLSPIELTLSSFNKSLISMTITHENKPIAMFGIMPKDMSTGILWMVTTYGLESNNFGRPFVRNCKKWFDAMLEIYPILIGIVDLRNTISIRWLTYLGCEWGDITTYGIDKLPFKYFSFRKKT